MKNAFYMILLFPVLSVAQGEYIPTCDRDAFERSFSEDERYIEYQPINSEEVEHILERYFSLSGEEKACADKITTDYISAYTDHCTKHGCFENIAGGCWHIASQQDWVYKVAYEACKP